MKKLLFIICLFSCLTGFGQAESFKRKTLDTLIQVRNSLSGSALNLYWLVRIEYDSTYRQDVALDPNKMRAVFIGAGGKGEVATGNYATDTAMINRYWWEYAHNNAGYDFSVQLNNGKHQPVMITILDPAANIHPEYVYPLLVTLKTLFPPRGGVFNVFGLSEGSWHWGNNLAFANGTSGNTAPMALIKTWVNLEGVGPETFQSTDWTIPGALAKWSTTFGGKVFGLEGTQDGRNIYNEIINPMNTAVAGSAYFAYQNYGGGFHCCWTQMSDPTVKNWRSIAPIVNANLVANSQNNMGTYTVDPTTGTNIFQWSLRQDDTTLVGGCNPIVTVGANQSFYLPQNSTTTTATISYQCGHGTGSTSWTQLSGPNTAVISGTVMNPSFTGLVAGTYQFQLNVTDNSGLIGNGIIQIVVMPAAPPVVIAGGPYSTTTSIVTLTGSVTAGSSSIVSQAWTQVSGPNTATITTPGSSSTTVTGMIIGTYVFKLSATDGNSNTSTSNASVSVSTIPITVLKTKVGPGEYQVFFIGPDSLLYALSTVANNTGTGGSLVRGIPKQVLTTPVNLKFVACYGSLHAGAGIDVNGNVWTWGDGDGGQIGNGTIYASPLLTPVMLTVDSLGNGFGNVSSMCAFYSANAYSGWYAIKADGTLWCWGPMYAGMRANGTYGSVVTRPTQIVLPAGKLARQVLGGAMMIVLMTDGTVYTCGGNGGAGAGSTNASDLGYAMTGTGFQTLTQLTSLTNIVQIAGGIKWNYAIKNNGLLYGWGSGGLYLGKAGGSGFGIPVTTPTELTELEAVLSVHGSIARLVTNSDGTHAITSDGWLWGWGDNAQGGIGNGIELDFSNQAALTPSGSTLWSYNLGQPNGLQQVLPVRITNKSNFQEVFGGSNFNYYTYAEDSTGQLYSWGRNKVGILGNGIIDPTGGAISQYYPNTWDVPLATPVDPLHLSQTVITITAGCISGQLPDTVGSACATYTWPANTPPVAIVGNQLINGPSTSIDVSASTDNVHISYYKLDFVSGPVTPVIDVASSKVVNATGMSATGTYQYRLTVTDNAWATNTTLMQVVVGIPTNFNRLLRTIGRKFKFLKQ